MAQSVDGDIMLQVGWDVQNLPKSVDRNINKTNNGLAKMSSLAKKAAIAIGAAFAVKQLVDFGKESLELGSDLAEVQNVVDVVFTSMSDKVNEFAKDAAETYGLSETMAKKYMGTFGAMADSFGFTEQATYDMAEALTGLTGDVASFYNMSQDEAYTKLKSVFTGETESLKELGVVMTQTALDQYAMANGFGKTTKSMTEQEKVALRYNFVLDQLSNAQGDFARTSDSWANQLRILKLRIESIKASIGQGLITMFTPIIKAVNALMARVQKATTVFQNFINLLFGKKSSATNNVQGVADASADADASMSGAADSAQDLADNTKKANKAAKKALGVYDELNVITKDTAASSSATPAAAESIDMGDSLIKQASDELDSYSQKLQSVVDMVKNAFETGDFTSIGATIGQKLKEALDNIPWDTVKEKAQKVAKSLATLLNGFVGTAGLGDSIGTTIAQGFNTAFAFVNTWLKTVEWKDVGTFLAGIINGAVKNFDWKQAGETLSNFASAIFTTLSSAIGNIEWDTLGGKIVEFFTGIKWGELFAGAASLLVNIAKAFGSLLKGIVTSPDFISTATEAATAIGLFIAGKIALTNFATKLSGLASSLGTAILDTLTADIGAVLGAGSFAGIAATVAIGLCGAIVAAVGGYKLGNSIYNSLETDENGDNAIDRFVTKMLDGIINFFTVKIPTFAEKIKTWWGSVLEKIGTLAFNIALDIGTKVTDFVSKFKEWFGKMKEKAGDIAMSIGAKIGPTVSSIAEKVKTFATKLYNKVKSFFELKLGIKLPSLATIKSKIIELWNGIKSWINTNVINRLNKLLAFTVPTNVATKALKINGAQVKLGTIPQLAKGAVIPPNSEFLAMLGDQKRGTNIEAPLDTIKQALIEAMQESGGGSGGDHPPIILQLPNGRAIIQLVWDEMEKQYKQTGSPIPNFA